MQKQKRVVLISTVLGLVCLTSVLGNNWGLGSSEEGTRQGSRGPASVIAKELRAIEEKVMRQIASLSNRKTASIGRSPDLTEQLRFEVLQGRYAFQMSGDEIQSLSFVDTPSSEAYPALIGDRAQFLQKYGKLLGVASADSISLEHLQIEGQKTFEIYKAGSNMVKFQLDELGRVIEMQVTRPKSPNG